MAEFKVFTTPGKMGEFFNQLKEEVRVTKLGKTTPYRAVNNILLRYAYRYARRWILKREIDKLKSQLEEHNIVISGELDRSLFVGCLEYLEEKSGVSLSRSNRYKLALQLQYAHTHNVESKWLLGFIYQAGGYSAISRKLKDNALEEWIDDEPEITMKDVTSSLVGGKAKKSKK